MGHWKGDRRKWGLNGRGFKGVHGLPSAGKREPVRVHEQGSSIV